MKNKIVVVYDFDSSFVRIILDFLIHICFSFPRIPFLF